MSKPYPYTMQPVAYSLSVPEQKIAQMELWKAGNRISTKTWIILGVISALAIAGIIAFRGAPTAFFWLLLVGVGLFLALRHYGARWYMQREMDKQPLTAIEGVKLGIQSQGLVMVQKMPNNQKVAKNMQGFQQLRAAEATGVIAWKDFTQWRETENYLYLFFEVKGQAGTQIIPKRMADAQFPIGTIRKHLLESVGPATP